MGKILAYFMKWAISQIGRNIYIPPQLNVRLIGNKIESIFMSFKQSAVEAILFFFLNEAMLDMLS